MPKPLFSKLVAICAIGFLCLLFGCVYGISTNDRILCMLSIHVRERQPKIQSIMMSGKEFHIFLQVELILFSILRREDHFLAFSKKCRGNFLDTGSGQCPVRLGADLTEK